MTRGQSKNLQRALWWKICLALVFMVAPVLGIGQYEGWEDSLTRARARARQSGQPLLVLFVHEGCPECARMARSLSHPRVRSALAPMAKAVLEFDVHRDLALRWNIEYTPTLLVFLPRDNYGSCVLRHVGALSPSALVRLAGRLTAACRPEAPSSARAATADVAHETSAPSTARAAAASPTRLGADKFLGMPGVPIPATSREPVLQNIYRTVVVQDDSAAPRQRRLRSSARR